MAVLAAIVTVISSSDRAAGDVIVLMAIYSIIALSIGISYGQAGVLSLAQGSFALLGAYSTGIATVHYHLSPWLGLVCAVLIPSICAYVIGRLVVRFSSLTLAIATLFVGEIIGLLMSQGGSFTGGYIGLVGIPFIPGFTSAVSYGLLAWAIVCVVVYGYSWLRVSAEGRALNTLRSDRLRARADGIYGAHLLAKTFAFSAGLAGIAGWLYAHYFTYVDPGSLGTSWSIIALLMAVVGGLRMTLGPVLGAVILTVVNQAVPGSTGTIIYGAALVVVLIVAPQGILGSAAEGIAWLARRSRPPHTDDRPTIADSHVADPKEVRP